MHGIHKKVALFLIATFILVVLPVARVAYSKEMAAKITYLSGECLLLKKGQTEWGKAALNMALYPGDKLRTKINAKVEVKFHDGSVVRIAQLSDFEVKTSSKNEETGENNIELKTKKGSYWTKFKKSTTAKNTLNQELPTAITGVRGTIYRIVADEDGKTVLRVYKGKVEVKTWLEAVEGQLVPKLKEDTGEKKEHKEVGPPKEVTGPKEVSMEEWIRTVVDMQQITLYPDKAPEEPEKFDPKEDAKDPWVQWNLERDKLLEEEGEN